MGLGDALEAQGPKFSLQNKHFKKFVEMVHTCIILLYCVCVCVYALN